MMGKYCRVGWYEDGDEIRIVVVHGTEITFEWVVEQDEERVISFRPLDTAVLSYSPAEGRLKVGGLHKAQRGPIADLFAATMLGKPNFFSRADARELYTLAPVEEAGFGFQFDHDLAGDPADVLWAILGGDDEILLATPFYTFLVEPAEADFDNMVDFAAGCLGAPARN
jgi:hypothetical protein